MKGTFACDKKQSGAWDENEIGHERTQGNEPSNFFCQLSFIHDYKNGTSLEFCIYYIFEYFESTKGSVDFDCLIGLLPLSKFQLWEIS